MGALLQEGTWLGTPWGAPDFSRLRPSITPDRPYPRSGRRDAALETLGLRGSSRSLDAVGRAFVAALHDHNRPKLESLAISEEEFTTILWPEFPQGRPPAGILASEAWSFVERRNRGGMARALTEWGGRSLEFVRLERPLPVERYRNFRLHRGLVLWILDGDGCLEPLDVLRAVVERRGIFKIFSLSD